MASPRAKCHGRRSRFPVKPPPLARASFTPDEIARITPEHTKFCQEMLQRDGGMRTGGLYLPFSERPSIMFPGTLGGANWHGPSYDPSLATCLPRR